jgi:GTPase
MEQESYYGNTEYKRVLINKSEGRKEKLATQMRFRVDEGRGEALYMIGVEDDGTLSGITDNEYDQTLVILNEIAAKNNYSLKLLSKKQITNKSDTTSRCIYEYFVRENNENSYHELRVAISGSVDVGKTTTLSVLTTGKLDNGRGLGRISIFNFRHELESGRTSSVAHHILGYDADGKIINYNGNINNNTWQDIVQRSRKIIYFNDLCGHEKYLKTTITGLTTSHPDICFILIGGNMGLTHITREHISLCITLRIPFCILITKIDICKDRENILDETIANIKRLLKLPGIRRIPYNVNTEEDVITASKNVYSGSIVPVFKISNVTGNGIDKVQDFLNITSTRKHKDRSNGNIEFHIDYTFAITGIGTVVGGNLLNGTVYIGTKLFLGPDMNGNYIPTQVRSIHCKRVPVTCAKAGTYYCFALKKVNKRNILKGNVLTDNPVTVREFSADISILKSHSTTIKIGYEPVVHTQNIRQTAKLINLYTKTNSRKNIINDDSILRTGDIATVRFRFMHKPEYIKPGYRFLFAEGRIRAIGTIKEIFID